MRARTVRSVAYFGSAIPREGAAPVGRDFPAPVGVDHRSATDPNADHAYANRRQYVKVPSRRLTPVASNVSGPPAASTEYRSKPPLAAWW